MHTKIYWLHTYAHGAKLGIMARPRGNDWLDTEINNLKKQNVKVLITLLELHEVRELGLQQEEHLCSQYDITYFNFPIPDRGVPAIGNKTEDLIRSVQQRLELGQSIVIHCRMGIGRSSIIAGAVMLKTMQNPKNILFHISNIRGLSVPDTAEQTKWLENRH
ncbi:phosphatase domain-containing putative toxin [Chryseolinea lacunae]|uniref:Dual specificity protein phosphatase family protein n=1 Tax=Chryseolinea lacunae TaxID=2801331 RepID=A0ABS1KXC3_9BACT|nr:dual specificity protein phosphatase family protein [Chryseolinea lacunae]MBL0743948.1 dual specificity protein phosphatase family protein [Chryseolinea lacunae]